MKVSYNITQNKFKVSFKTGYYPLPVGLEKAIQELNAKNLELEERLIKLEKLLSNG